MQVTTDTRDDWERLRRIDLWHLADAWNIPYPAGATKIDMISILSANQVNPNDPRGAYEWDIVHSQDEMGKPVVSRYPKRKVHATANKDIDYAGILDKKAQDEMEEERDSLRDEVEKLNAMMAAMLKAQEDTKVTVDLAEKETVAYPDMKFHELKKVAKQKGLVIPNTDKKVDILAKLEGLDGQDTT